jgi:hypothetical protein
MMTYREWKYSSTHSLTSALDGDVVSFTLRSLYPQERAIHIYWIGGWVGSRAGLDTVSKWIIPSHRRDSNPQHLIVQPVVSYCIDWAAMWIYFYTFLKRLSERRRRYEDWCVWWKTDPRYFLIAQRNGVV